MGDSRRGFTLIELLVVIAIIAILAAILSGSVFKVWNSARDTKTRHEIGQLELAVEMFKQKHGIYPPSIIQLREAGGYDTPGPDEEKTQLMNYSANMLRRIFPGIDLEIYRSTRQWHDWNGNGGTAPDGPITLHGAECLVFFLGGIAPHKPEFYGPDGLKGSPGPDGELVTADDDLADDLVNLTGFCPDRTRPTQETTRVARDSMFEFDGARLFRYHPQRWLINPKNVAPTEYPVYCDPFGTPYEYFRLAVEEIIIT